MHIQESGEMYLETIFVLSKERDTVRSIDVAEHLGYSKPSVSRAMGILKNGGYGQRDCRKDIRTPHVSHEISYGYRRKRSHRFGGCLQDRARDKRRSI